MITHVDNHREGVLVRLLHNWAPALCTTLALVGAVGLPLRGLRAARVDLDRARTDHARAAELRAELDAFHAAGGDAALAALRDRTGAILPRELSRVDLRAALQVVAEASDLELSALAISAPRPTRHRALDDAVVACEVSLSGRGRPSALAALIRRTRDLGYPLSLQSFQLDRPAVDDARFEVHAVLKLYQAVPRHAVPDPRAALEEDPR